ncbi:dicarboxylate/amino acid:cation symporter [Endozoicomonas sp. OPT23]|uniref:dicarboxylate/amino acid:cation symporter n=1 Tax=Endozoicomonas sp. OPT23 TaxID=2072845 RepID=UPI00129C0D69|nr:dicarboxylate/amino acid:cation symporter [Endozoicomonas sp. OPT23]MRI33196.1 dicarboxylate/amino acid:cation symporter [Endozoicomonas sp. OPT23]
MNNNLATRIMTALAVGLILGGSIQIFASPEGFFQSYLVDGLFHAGGSIFVGMIKLLVVPLIFISIVNAVCSLEDIGQFGRFGFKTFGLYLVNTVIAISAAIGLAMIVQPGVGANLGLVDETLTLSRTNLPNLLDMVIGVVPTNPFQAFAEGNILQILFMAIITGVAVKKLENHETHSVSNAFALANSVMMKLITMVMSLAPYGVFFLTAKLGATLDGNSIISVLTYVATALAVMAVWVFVFYPLVIGATTSVSPKEFLRATREQMLFSISTASSNATIPVTFRTLTEKLGVSEKVAGFSVPLGATMNMSGAAIYMVVATIFVANAYGIDLNGTALFTLGFTAFLLAIATGGIPGGAVVTTGVLLHTLGLPIEALGIIVATDRILDAACTVTNVVGDTAVSTIVAKTEGQIGEGTETKVSGEVQYS